MRISLLAEMAAEAAADRVGVGSSGSGTTYGDLLTGSRRVAAWLQDRSDRHVAMLDVNSEAVPLLLFGASLSGKPVVPLNYRLAPDRLKAIIERVAPAVVVAGDGMEDVAGPVDGVEYVSRSSLLSIAADPSYDASRLLEPDDDVAVLLFTSGTTGDPKAAVLRHRHLTAYVLGTVEFLAADPDEAALVSVPPYHIAGLMAVLTSVYAGRRICYLPAFGTDEWVATVRREGITHAMVVPTMLGRILDLVERGGVLPTLRSLSYGGGRMPVSVIERALQLLPGTDFVNAYGLTETSSTIAVLGPDDHRRIVASDQPVVRRRLGSVGRPLPTVDVEIRDAEGRALSAGEIGEICVRGEQVSGEYVGRREVSEDGWFRTRDAGWLDDEGFLFVDGRLDDVIVRGAENISPGEVEDVLIQHPAVKEAAVVGVPDQEWGERVVAAVVLAPGADAAASELQEWVRDRLRSSRTPQEVVFYDALPYNETGKLLRRELRGELSHTGS